MLLIDKTMLSDGESTGLGVGGLGFNTQIPPLDVGPWAVIGSLYDAVSVVKSGEPLPGVY